MSENPTSFDLNGTEAPPPPNGPDNRGFILAVSILGGLFLIALLIMGGYLAMQIPKNRAQQSTRVAQINFANTSTVSALTQVATQLVKSPTPVPPTATVTRTATATATATLQPTFTPVLAIATSTQMPVQTITLEPRTATVSALLTQAAQAQQTGTALPTSTALPKTGIAEDMRLPSLLGLTLILLAVIFVARRLRASRSLKH